MGTVWPPLGPFWEPLDPFWIPFGPFWVPGPSFGYSVDVFWGAPVAVGDDMLTGAAILGICGSSIGKKKKMERNMFRGITLRAKQTSRESKTAVVF